MRRSRFFFYHLTLLFLGLRWQDRWGKALSAWDCWEVCWGLDTDNKIWHTSSPLPCVNRKLVLFRGVRHRVFLVKELGM